MKKFNFNIKNKFINSFLFLNKSFIIFFSIILFLFTFPTLLLTLITHISYSKFPYIAPTTTTVGNTSDTPFSVYDVLNYITYSTPSIILFIIANMVVINKNIIKDINEGYISFWLTIKSTRKDLFLSKIISIYLYNLFIFMPSFLILLLFSAISADAKNYFASFLYQSLQFMILIFLISSIMLVTSIYVTDKVFLYNIIFGIVSIYIVSVWVLYIIDIFMDHQIKVLNYAKYFLPQYFIFYILEFDIYQDKLFSDSIINNERVVVKQSSNYNTHWWNSIIFPTILLIIGVITNILSIRKFNSKNIYI
ncbi:hypothetical protein [Spiroplasma turonicum]|uniref:Uncharacterized protein n=1 Tax=Spiroplasma turonicum TaxID=216946 RepID=A0A0K1P728_9MOLU|nr:hypothetical protein [Spiroplasma turonicum]AKU80085.1 hypothetical protein STURON_00839 [Spiroplasma turonicum]ALX71086.1 hypothetical protein STURO_v1c08350 [Spiroplasma turonicum]